MNPDDRIRALWLIVVTVVVVAVGILVILGILRSWRNYNDRQRLLDQGRQLRESAPGKKPPQEYVDTWREAGERLKPEPAEPDDEDPQDDTSNGHDKPPFPRN